MLCLKANPTFKAKVGIPVPGGEPVQVEMEFRHRTRDELVKFLESSADMNDDEAVMAVITGWGLDDKLTRENVHRLTQNYYGAGRAIVDKYLAELTQARLGN